MPHYQRTRVLCKRGNHWCHCYGLLTCTAVGTCLTCTAVGAWDLHVCCCSVDTMHAQESESKYEQCSTILHGAQQQLLCSRLGQCFSPTVTALMLPLSVSWWSWHQLHAQSPAAPSRWPAAKQWQQQIQTTQLRGTSWGTQCLLQWVAKLMVALLQLCSKHSANCAARHVTHHHPGESTSTSRCAAHSGQQGEQCIFVPFSFSHCAPARDDSKR